MKDGVNTLVGNAGVKLSGGQQARVALARTLYRRAPIIILDDPFSAVDMKTERQIIENLRSYHSEQIILLISHRLSIFTEASNIMLMNLDKTYEYGTHDELMKKSSLYNDLFNLQASKDGDDNEK
jgi:ABC-type multidrug transport system fused ATPase/permease subunit